MRNNVVYDSTTIGIAIGGYDRRRGSTEDCRDREQHRREHRWPGAAGAVRHARQPDREQPDRRRGPAHLRGEPVRGERRQRPGREPLLLGRRERGGHLGVEGRGPRRLRRVGGALGQRSAVPLRRPRLRRSRGVRLRAAERLAGVDAGAFLAWPGRRPAGEPRAQAGGIDIGAFETTAPPPSPTPSIAGAGHVRRGSGVDGGPQRLGTPGGRPPATASASPTTADRSRSAPRRSRMASGRTRPSRIIVDLGAVHDVPGRRRARRGGRHRTARSCSRSGTRTSVWRAAASSGATRPRSRSPPTSTGSASVALVVTPAGDGPAFDHADWGDARFACEA